MCLSLSTPFLPETHFKIPGKIAIELMMVVLELAMALVKV
jgi:hypothetical protein